MKSKNKQIIIWGAIIVIATLIVFFTRISIKNNSPTQLSPVGRTNTNWTNDNICFSVCDNSQCLGKLKAESEMINIQILFGTGFDTSITIEDYDAKIKENYVFNPERYLLSGDCKFKEDSFTIKVTDSKIDYIKKGDKITFNLVDELPEWATQVTETDEESD
ncbi:MAG: hypothetical protein E7500_06395 [Ruminococcus sp.]|nr:hypothetical protein [Ruminococcus sp.]